MIRLGSVLHVSANRNLIVKLEKIPRIGEVVVDENFKPVGDVFDIFGPVTAPYAAIKPKISNPEILVNKMLYISPRKKKIGGIQPG
ncbi:MAG: Gar1/Naf1 family protein [Candidatus Bathyarchaeota archaeon]|nr:Gar1/Naf1 family protein [Candidatus Bathyarchaeota archaeon]MCX8177398.1 Gar1/Naf1 family protein [Candidatus Bathyarchaeota archaeon]MDW8193845.1 Gar1/Naf1 family protein [Nitrososphaerota archaeon]